MLLSGRIPRLVTPPKPGSAVVHGAALFGVHASTAFSSRKARLTYAAEGLRQAQFGDPARLRVVSETGEIYTRVLQVFVHRGETVPTAKVVEHFFSALSDSMTRMKLALFSTEAVNPVFPDEPGLVHEGDVTVEMPDTSRGREREVCLKFKFGGSAITVTATDITTGIEQSTNLTFNRR